MTNQTQARPAPPAASRPPAAPEAPAKPSVTYRVSYHVLTPAGFPMDIQRDVGSADLVAWVKAQDDLLVRAGFKPREAEVKVELPAAGQTGGHAASDDSWAPAFCPDCGKPRSDWYDNRNDPNRPTGGPDLKCKCGHGFWKDPPRNGAARRSNR